MLSWLVYTSLFVFIICLILFIQVGQSIDIQKCNIQILDLKDVKRNDYQSICKRVLSSNLIGSVPFLVKTADNDSDRLLFRNKTSLETLQNNCEICKELMVDVSTANSYTGRKVYTMTLSEYLDKYLHPQDTAIKGNETLYLFGGHNSKMWNTFLDQYKPAIRVPTENILLRYKLAKRINEANSLYSISLLYPIEETCMRIEQHLKDEISLSFGIASENTGVPFHHHGPGFLETIHGRKHMWLVPPGKPLPFDFDPDENVYNWYMRSYQKALKSMDECDEDSQKKQETEIYECTINPGEILYFPDKWTHATLNLDFYNVFVANFG